MEMIGFVMTVAGKGGNEEEQPFFPGTGSAVSLDRPSTIYPCPNYDKCYMIGERFSDTYLCIFYLHTIQRDQVTMNYQTQSLLQTFIMVWFEEGLKMVRIILQFVEYYNSDHFINWTLLYFQVHQQIRVFQVEWAGYLYLAIIFLGRNERRRKTMTIPSKRTRCRDFSSPIKKLPALSLVKPPYTD